MPLGDEIGRNRKGKMEKDEWDKRVNMCACTTSLDQVSSTSYVDDRTGRCLANLQQRYSILARGILATFLSTVPMIDRKPFPVTFFYVRDTDTES